MTTPLAEALTVSNETNAFIKAHPASFEAQVAVTVLIVVLGVWSTFGNTVTILAIAMHKDMQKKSNFFIFSLAISDLISGMIASPLWLYRRTWGYQNWLWGDFLCKLFWFTDESTSYCTAVHIASFAIWRYIGVRWPHAHAKISKKKVKIWLLSVWTITVTFGGIIFCNFYQAEDRSTTGGDKARWPSCSIITSEEGIVYPIYRLRRHKIYYTFSSSTFMLLPMAILFSTSVLITREFIVRNKSAKSESRRKSENRAIVQLALISTSFLIGYIPNLVYVMWTSRAVGVDYRLDYWVHVGCYFALRTSECINPVVYNVSSERMRKSSKKVLHFIWHGCRSKAERELDSMQKQRSKCETKNSTDVVSKGSINHGFESNAAHVEMSATNPNTS